MTLQLGQSRDSLNHQEQMERKREHKQKLHLRRLKEGVLQNLGFEIKYLRRSERPRGGWDLWKAGGFFWGGRG